MKSNKRRSAIKTIVSALLSAAIFWLILPDKPPAHINNQVPSAVKATKAEMTVKPAIQQRTEVKPQKTEPTGETVAVVKDISVPNNPQPAANTPDAWMDAVGLTEEERHAARYIIGQESSWCPTKWQGNYGTCPAFHGVPSDPNVGYGLCQSTPAHKMAEMGSGWETDPILQLKWCDQYVQAYGGWVKAAEFKRCTGWCYSTRILATTYKHTPWL